MRIHGQIHHRIGPLQNNENEPKNCAQIYFSGENEHEDRMKYTSELNPLTLIQIQSMLIDECKNPFVLQFKKASQIAKGNNIDH